VLEEDLADFPRREILREVDPQDLGAERAGNAFDLYFSTVMFCALMIEA
jgi:hypothetical protein